MVLLWSQQAQLQEPLGASTHAWCPYLTPTMQDI